MIENRYVSTERTQFKIIRTLSFLYVNMREYVRTDAQYYLSYVLDVYQLLL